MKKFLKIVVNITLVTTLGISLYKISNKLVEYKKSDNVYNSIEEIYSSNKDSKEKDSYTKLKEINDDYRFWIEVDNTNINYPVVQGNDNETYLKKDFLKNSSNSGTVFLDYKNDFNTDFNNLIYGHNMKNKKIFSNLEKFKKEDFFNSNNKIHLSDKKYKYTYEVYSVYIVDGNSDEGHHYEVNTNADYVDRENYFNEMKEKSMFKSNLTLNQEDKLITLVTCSYEKKDARTIVHGKLLSKEPLS